MLGYMAHGIHILFYVACQSTENTDSCLLSGWVRRQ